MPITEIMPVTEILFSQKYLSALSKTTGNFYPSLDIFFQLFYTPWHLQLELQQLHAALTLASSPDHFFYRTM